MGKHFRHYTGEELRFVEKNIRGRSYVEMTKLFNERFRLRITLKQMETLLYKHGLRNGIGSFRPGHVPANKGKTHPGRQGNYKPVGTERVDAGYIAVKVSARKNRGNKNWRRKHDIIWEAVNGKIPRGHAVIFADGNRRNLKPENLVLVSRKELAVLNHAGMLASKDADTTKVSVTFVKLKIRIAELKKKRSKLKRGWRRV
jgi:hypothetical protein